MFGNNTTPGNATNYLEYDNFTFKTQYPLDWSIEGASNSVVILLRHCH